MSGTDQKLSEVVGGLVLKATLVFIFGPNLRPGPKLNNYTILMTTHNAFQIPGEYYQSAIKGLLLYYLFLLIHYNKNCKGFYFIS